jgi:SAM-dependent methyltransferase
LDELKMGFQAEIDAGQRFEFGKNWQNFLSVLNEERISEAEKSLTGFLNCSDLSGLRFLDVGSGSGLHSLAARRLGAEVVAFDYDPQAVACTLQLKQRYFHGDSLWTVYQGSALDLDFIRQLGRFNVCYAWGVLHHTGSLWQALDIAQGTLEENGLLFIALYNDQGLISAFWRLIKRVYCSGVTGRWAMTLIFFPLFFLGGLLIDFISRRNPIARYREHIRYRGMSLIHDWRDWLGGYPYKPARPDEVITFLKRRGFELLRFEPTRHGFGNNQYLFRKSVSINKNTEENT